MTDKAGATITATFSTRRQADLAVETLVQELGIERTDVFVTADGEPNSAGSQADGADVESGHPGVEPAGDPALAGGLSVSVDLLDEQRSATVKQMLEQHGGEDVSVE